MNAPLSAQNKGLVLQWRGHRFYLDTVLLITSLALLLFGYVMVTSASLHLGDKLAGDSYYFPRHQLIHIALGLMAGVMAGSVKLETWRDISLQLFFAGLVLLVVVLIPGIGKVVNGSSRWINLLGLRIQVSEVFKLIAVVYMASFIDRHISVVRTSYQGMLRPFLLLGVAAFLLLKEPDFGATAVILSVALGMLFLAGASLWQFGALIAVFVGGGVAWVLDPVSRRCSISLRRTPTFCSR